MLQKSATQRTLEITDGEELRLGVQMQNEPNTPRSGVHALGSVFSEAGWLFREQTTDDRGIDAQVEVVHDGESTGELIAIQVKSGVSYFDETSDGCVVYRADAKHIAYWFRLSLPVIVVLFDPVRKILLWAPVTKETALQTGKQFKILIPDDAVLTTETVEAIRRGTRPAVHIRRFDRLILDVEWMRYVADGWHVTAQFDDWVNKSLPRTHLTIVANRGTDQVAREFPLLFTAGFSPIEAVQRLLPWADLHMDEEAHRESAWSMYDAECFFTYDRETDTTHYTSTFEDWYSPPEGIVPVEENGETEVYQVVLSLNDIGASFLVLHEYLFDDPGSEALSFTVDDL